MARLSITLRRLYAIFDSLMGKLNGDQRPQDPLTIPKPQMFHRGRNTLRSMTPSKSNITLAYFRAYPIALLGGMPIALPMSTVIATHIQLTQ